MIPDLVRILEDRRQRARWRQFVVRILIDGRDVPGAARAVSRIHQVDGRNLAGDEVAVIVNPLLNHDGFSQRPTGVLVLAHPEHGDGGDRDPGTVGGNALVAAGVDARDRGRDDHHLAGLHGRIHGKIEVSERGFQVVSEREEPGAAGVVALRSVEHRIGLSW